MNPTEQIDENRLEICKSVLEVMVENATDDITRASAEKCLSALDAELSWKPQPPKTESKLKPSIAVTTDPSDPRLGVPAEPQEHAQEKGYRTYGQNLAYLVLSDDELKKGFVRPVRDTYTHLLCKVNTTMSKSIAETYARNPKFYSSTFCVGCQCHLPLNEFVWKGTEIEVGT